MNKWYEIENIEQIDSPALVVYQARIKANIETAKKIINEIDRLRPHVKTNKMTEVCRLMLQAGISKFTCATIAEAEMLALAGSPDILMAYQPVGPKINRLINLMKAYPASHFSCLIDNQVNASIINNLCREQDVVLDVFIDLNVGMNRTGIYLTEAYRLAKTILALPNLCLAGLHGYDGHIHEPDVTLRQQ